MSFAQDLLEQASLRRAISTAYYGLFHLLAEATARLLVGGRGSEREAMRNSLRRSFTHTDMKKAALSFSSSAFPEAWRDAIGTPTNAERQHMQTVAEAFVDLQEARHSADYDMGLTYTRREAGNW